ncbi:MAG: hypothetical protein JWP69_218 [Flaviaesturariibacter sp.]|nr:hypothetical protein [Flaviaesturariibacter sp.]
MKSIAHLPKEDQEHFAKCDSCNQYFDMRNLTDVFRHEHGALPLHIISFSHAERLPPYYKTLKPLTLN